MSNSRNIQQIIKEEMTKPEIVSLLNNKIDSHLNSKDFEKKVREISTSVVGELFRLLWQQKSFWENRIKK